MSTRRSCAIDWVTQLADDPQHAFPGKGQMKPEQLEIAQLKREVIKPFRRPDPPVLRNETELHINSFAK